MANDTPAPVIVWFRRDLRIADNPALTEAAATGGAVVPLYIHDERLDGRPMGAASKWWLDRSLRVLAADLRDRGAPVAAASVRAGLSAILRSRLNQTMTGAGVSLATQAVSVVILRFGGAWAT